jgi:hypothetical protein
MIAGHYNEAWPMWKAFPAGDTRDRYLFEIELFPHAFDKVFGPPRGSDNPVSHGFT